MKKPKMIYGKGVTHVVGRRLYLSKWNHSNKWFIRQASSGYIPFDVIDAAHVLSKKELVELDTLLEMAE